MFDTINNPAIKIGIVLGAIVISIWFLSTVFFMIKNAIFKPKRGLSVEQRFDILTNGQKREKTGFEKKYK
jgi:hypothetical protein